jgi:hypothetical protein
MLVIKDNSQVLNGVMGLKQGWCRGDGPLSKPIYQGRRYYHTPVCPFRKPSHQGMFFADYQ